MSLAGGITHRRTEMGHFSPVKYGQHAPVMTPRLIMDLSVDVMAEMVSAIVLLPMYSFNSVNDYVLLDLLGSE